MPWRDYWLILIILDEVGQEAFQHHLRCFDRFYQVGDWLDFELEVQLDES